MSWYGIPERVLQRPGLRVGPVEHRDVAVPEREGPARLEEERDHPLPFGLFVRGQVHPDLLPRLVLGPELLLLPRGVVLHDAVRGAEDGLRGAVVLGQAEHGRLGEGLLEGEDVPHVGAAPAVDGLVVVPHHGQVAVDPRQALDEAELDPVRVLVFVHEHVQEPGRVHAMDLLVQIEEAHREPDQIVEIHRAPLTERLLVAGVHLRQPPVHDGECRLREFLRPHRLVLEPRDPPARHGRSQALVLGARSFQEIAKDRALIVGVVDDEVLGIAQELRVASQDPNAGAVKGAQPDTQVLASQQGLRPGTHLPRGFVCEGEGEDRALGDAALAHQVRDAAGQDAGLAASRAGEDQEGPAGVLDRLALHGVEVHASPNTRV